MAYCEKCGNKLNGNEKFCPKCGSKITLSENDEKVSSSQNANNQEGEPKSSCLVKALKIVGSIFLIMFIFGLIRECKEDDAMSNVPSELANDGEGKPEETNDNVYCEFSVTDLAGRDFHFILEDNGVGIGGDGMLTVKSASEEAVSPFRWADQDSIIIIVLSNPAIEFLFPSGKHWHRVVYDKKDWLYTDSFSQKYKETDSRLKAVRKK